MEEESLLPASLHSQRSNALPLSSSLSSEIADPLLPSTSDLASTSWPRRKSPLYRARTAPAMAVVRDLLPRKPDSSKPPNFGSAGSILKYSSVLLLVYLSLGVLVYSMSPQGFSGVETHPAVDALYFCIVTLCTIGYGDIYPLTPATKAFSCVFVLVGFGVIDVLLSGAVNYVLDVQENLILEGARAGAGVGAASYVFDAEKGRMRIRMKVALAIGVVLLCVGAGTLALYLVEDLDWMDSLYLSVMSVTTVGYGDRAFKTLPGRVFASVWLLVSTVAVARAFLYLAEARIDKRHRRIAKWVLHRDLTVEDLLAADLNQNGFISKSEFVIYKLKEMGKIGEKDILQICNQFHKLDPINSGKITLLDLLNSSR
ncbi:two-pore potassium channel 5 [Elaeis guineensis]|uniref:Two-pore potassium channel 5 n=1 Tax=Elaeis guineensis var. tenera TaxID=51953 RepID=A0A6I9S7R4_ELAGV|nr:two-pore potassium channel 5 [Elaeis guineensis]XP_019710364.1 two-pore potassium channel 5 [Elaeis guineensis]